MLTNKELQEITPPQLRGMAKVQELSEARLKIAMGKLNCSIDYPFRREGTVFATLTLRYKTRVLSQARIPLESGERRADAISQSQSVLSGMTSPGEAAMLLRDAPLHLELLCQLAQRYLDKYREKLGVELFSPEARRLDDEKAQELQKRVQKLVRRWLYLLGLFRWDVEVAVVKEVSWESLWRPPGSMACVIPKANWQATLEMAMHEDHPYSIEHLVVHELLHLPLLELEEEFLSRVPQEMATMLKGKVFRSELGSWAEGWIWELAETLVSLLHGYVPDHGEVRGDEVLESKALLALPLVRANGVWQSYTSAGDIIVEDQPQDC